MAGSKRDEASSNDALATKLDENPCPPLKTEDFTHEFPRILQPVFQGLTQIMDDGIGKDLSLTLQAAQDQSKQRCASHAEINTYLEAFLVYGRYLQDLLFRKGNKVVADSVVSCYQHALELDPSSLEALSGLVVVRNFQYMYLGDRRFLDEAIEIACECLTAGPVTDAECMSCIFFAALSLEARAEADGCFDDLEVAIELLRLGENLESPREDSKEDFNTVFRLALADFLAFKFEILEHGEDMDEAQRLVKWATESMQISSRYSIYKNDVKGRVYLIRFKKLRHQDDCFESFKAYAASWSLTVNDGAAPATATPLTLKRLAEVSMLSYYLKVQSLLLSRASDMARLALVEGQKLCQSWGSGYLLSEVYVTMGEVQCSRFFKYRDPRMLDDAIVNFRESVKLTGYHDSRFTQRAADLIGALRDRFMSDLWSRYQRHFDRQEAVYWAAEAMRAKNPLRASERANLVLELGHLVGDLNFWNGNNRLERLDLRLCLYQKAAEATTSDFEISVASWKNLAQVLIDKGDLLQVVDYYDRGKEYLDKIEGLAASANYRATGHLPLVARLHLAKYNLTSTADEALEAAKAYYEIFYKSNYDPDVKINAALSYTSLITRLTLAQTSEANTILKQLSGSGVESMRTESVLNHIVDVFMRIVSRGLPRQQQLRQIRTYSALPLVNAIASKIAGKTGSQILRNYEYGRSIVWDRFLNRKIHLDSLAESHPELAAQYQDLDRALEGNVHDKAWTKFPRDKYQLEADLQDLVREIVAKKGFEDFQRLPLSEAEIQNYGRQGPIIFPIAASPSGKGFAVLISATLVEIVDLPSFNEENCTLQYAKLKTLTTAYNCPMKEAEQSLMDVLKWLWYALAQPVLQKLNIIRTQSTDEGSSSTELPRIWWVTCTWTNLLPVHAAGDHKAPANGIDRSRPTVVDNAISSYTPTLKALSYARTKLSEMRRDQNLNDRKPYAFLGAMSKTQDHPSLEHALPETKAAQEILAPKIHSELVQSPNLDRKTTLQHLRTCTIAHLACHGVADSKDPLRSTLLLQDWGPKPLRVGWLMRMEMTNCQLAYLSACQTAVNSDEKLAEEGLHLSGAFQMAGVPCTVATVWEIADADAVDVAKGFYQALKGQEGDIDATRSSRALHASLKELRDRGASPFTWAGFVHFGA
ncbi:hypothetical protein ACLMJK_003847 [Lecanora helva]